MPDEGPPSPSDRDPLSIACELVGQFQYHFARIEAALNQGIAKVLDLNEGATDIVCANLDFMKKLSIIKSAVALQFTDTDGSLMTLLSRISGVNNPDRQIVIHSIFEPHDEGGVQFTRIRTRDELERLKEHWDTAAFQQRFRNMENLAAELKRVVAQLRPYVPSLDFSDPRNSMYLALLF